MQNRFLSNRQSGTFRIAVSSTSLFPDTDQSFVYSQYLLFHKLPDVEFMVFHTDVGDPRNLPPGMHNLFEHLIYVRPNLETHLADYNHYKQICPKRVSSLMDAISSASGINHGKLDKHFDLMLSFSYARVVQALGVNYLHSWFPNDQSLHFLVTSWMLDIPRGISIYDGTRCDYSLKLLPLHLQTADLVIANTDETLQGLVSISGEAITDKITVVNPESSMTAEMERIRELVRLSHPHLRTGINAAYRTLPKTRYNDQKQIMRFVVIAGERTGSNMLIELLGSHANVLSIGEIFNSWFIEHNQIPWTNKKALTDSELLALRIHDPETFLEKIFEMGAAKGCDSIGFKLLYYHGSCNGAVLDYLLNNRSIKIIHLRRRNRLRRYLSQRIAEQSGSWYQSGSWWHQLMSKQKSSMLSHSIEIDPTEIIKDFEHLAFEEEKYEALFLNHSTLNLFYEDLSTELTSMSSNIAEFLNISVRKLKTRSKRNKTVELNKAIANYDELKKALIDTKWAQYFNE